MNIKITIYDIFANTIPGIINIFVIAYFLNVSKLFKVDFKTFNFSFSQILLLIVLAYILGLIIDIISFKLWYQLASKNKDDTMYQTSYDELKKRYERFDFPFQANEWPILLSKLVHISSEWAQETNKFNALYIMMRNISFSLFILSIVGILDLILSGVSILVIVTIVFSALFSIMSITRAALFEKYFYNMIFEGCLALDIKTPNDTNVVK